MQVNNVFSAGRFGLYLRKHLIDNYRIYGMSVIVLTVLLLIAVLFNLDGNFRYNPRIGQLLPLYFIGMFITGLIFTSLSFSELASKPQGIDYLLFPASQLEKFLSTMLMTTAGFLVLYHIAFYFTYLGIDMIMVQRTGQHLANDLSEVLRDTHIFYFYHVWFVLQAVMLLGAIYFQKYTFIKTVFFFAIFLFALYFLNGLFAKIFFGDRMSEWTAHFPFIGVNIRLGEELPALGPQPFRMLILPKVASNSLLFFAKYLVTPILWSIAYMRLRDKEM